MWHVSPLQDEWELEEAYFQRLERKEILEERLRDVKELKVRVVQCKEVCHSLRNLCSGRTSLLVSLDCSQCNYVAEKESELCRKENHVLIRLRAIKRCYQCHTCQYRCFTYNQRFPVQSCK